MIIVILRSVRTKSKKVPCTSDCSHLLPCAVVQAIRASNKKNSRAFRILNKNEIKPKATKTVNSNVVWHTHTFTFTFSVALFPLVHLVDFLSFHRNPSPLHSSYCAGCSILFLHRACRNIYGRIFLGQPNNIYKVINHYVLCVLEACIESGAYGTPLQLYIVSISRHWVICTTSQPFECTI